MEFTGERYVPQLVSAKISYEHWHRYIFASRFCAGKNVLDIACGEGYGTAYLAGFAQKIYGADIAPDAIQHAKAKYDTGNIEFLVASATQIALETESFDTIVSFETLEHLTAADQELFIREAVRLLKPGGVLIISTPNKKIYSDDPNYSNPYHLAEFYKHEFEAFVKKYFPYSIIYSQGIIGGSIISRSNEPVFQVDHLHLGKEGFIPGNGNASVEREYLIAVCSLSPLSHLAGSILLDHDNRLIE